MSDISEKDWKSALTSILEELEKSQYSKMLECLDKIPRSQKTSRSKEKMPGKIIQHYGLEESISAISDAMDQIPRRDSAVQDLLRPFVDKLKNKQNKGRKRKRDPVKKEKGPAAAPKESCRLDKETNSPPQRKFIRDLKSRGQLLDTEVIVGKVVQKSELLTYQTKDNVEKFFFYLAVADETASVKVMVYGKERYREIKKESSYLFGRLIIDENVVKVTMLSNVAKTEPVQVPGKIEMEARKIIYSQSPVCSIVEAKSSASGTDVSVEGTVTEIDPVKQVYVQHTQQMTKRKVFYLEDETDRIRICMWGEDTDQCEGLSPGDVVLVTNMKTTCYYEDVSLNSTRLSRVYKV